jgi:hypothetical protein
MGTRRRRRLDALLLAGVAALVGVAALLAAAFVRSERITRLWAGADVGADGAARVVEVIDYDFGNRERHGIFRDVPGLNPDDLVEVSSPSAPDQVQVTGTAQQTRLRIGDPYRTVSGRHRYRIAYPLAGVAPGGRLAWDAVGTSWPVEIGAVELHVVAPFRLEGARCVQGATGSEAGCPVSQPEPGHLMATVDGLEEGEGVTLYATAGAPWPPPRPCRPRRPTSPPTPAPGRSRPPSSPRPRPCWRPPPPRGWCAGRVASRSPSAAPPTPPTPFPAPRCSGSMRPTWPSWPPSSSARPGS